jgi:hypothetical protein
MINSPIKILDNSGCSFTSENGQIILGQPINGFRPIGYADLGSTISYLCKNKNSYEVGIGKVISNNDKILLDRIKVLQSSSNNQPIEFGNDSTNVVYSFANSYNFRTAFNNLISQNSDFNIEPVNATYYVGLLLDNVSATLPPAKDNQSLCLEFKTTSGPKTFTLLDNTGKTTLVLTGNKYSKLICTGEHWVELKDEASYSSQNFTSLAYEAASPEKSLQYNVGGSLSGSNLYIGLNNKLLLGSSTEETAQVILPTSGSYPVVFNNLRTSSDFIVKGSGDKSLWFLNSGKVGINVPITASPESVSTLHVVNTACGEGIRLENRNQCSTADITLYNRPQQLPDAGSIISSINLSSKNSTNQQVEFAQVRGRALSSVTNATSGEFSVAVNRINNQIEILTANAEQTNIVAGTNRLKVSTSGIDLIGNVRLSSLKWNLPSSSGQILISDSNGNLVLTNVSNTPIMNILDGDIVVFTGVCT